MQLVFTPRSHCRVYSQWRSQPDIWSCKCKFFYVYGPYEESISKEMNNDNDLNLHSMTKLSGWLRYCVQSTISLAGGYRRLQCIKSHLSQQSLIFYASVV